LIPVIPQPEPSDFDQKVRQPGRAWIAEKGHDPSKRVPKKTKIEPYWRDSLDDLHRAYGGICAYLCVYIERTSPPTVDHFVSKLQRLDLAYEWSNYRLAYSMLNSRKGEFQDVLDPFTLALNTFELDLFEGGVWPANHLGTAQRGAAQATINRLNLNDPICRAIRLRFWEIYIRNRDSEFLQTHSPFVWLEAQRQGLL
jgi:hypothetical protein